MQIPRTRQVVNLLCRCAKLEAALLADAKWSGLRVDLCSPPDFDYARERRATHSSFFAACCEAWYQPSRNAECDTSAKYACH